MPAPVPTPIGRELARVAKSVARAFDDELAAAGGSLPQWLILISLKTRQLASQRELAEAVGIQGATLTVHLDAMQTHGLLTRRRDPTNRRVHLVELTAEGQEAFSRLRRAAADFDHQLRAGISDRDIATLYRLLARLQHNVADEVSAADATS
ncbi:MAG: MarR family transcriptional regulator [Intrasporangium sp.]|uniref:MarR family winged helix-turn-helix transcriptional regulator n=1 Tax=Intrasporangium sp. TaxID=1925024 RepID=UPI0026476C48|nr:MarR family transcriptional regulator [Intrasporangium sp.]MDN5796916.1 MarR family transcriptional regulator [Intrasporangium sp.]